MITETRLAIAAAVEADIVAGWGQDESWAPRNNYASKAAHPCAFYLWAYRARHDEFPAADPGLMGIFKTGRELQRSVEDDLREAGYEVTHQEVRLHDERLQLSGRMDCRISRADRGLKNLALEIKGVHPGYFDDLTSVEAMLTGSRPWVRLWPGQALLYGFCGGDDAVGLLLRDKSSRKTRLLIEDVADHWDIMRGIEATLTTVNEHIASGEPPDPMPFDEVWCTRCDCKDFCSVMTAKRALTPIVEDVEDPDLDTLVAQALAAAPAKKDAAAIDRRLKTYLTDVVGFYVSDEPERITTLGGYQVTVTPKGGKRYLKFGPVTTANGA